MLCLSEFLAIRRIELEDRIQQAVHCMSQSACWGDRQCINVIVNRLVQAALMQFITDIKTKDFSLERVVFVDAIVEGFSYEG